MDTLLKFVKSMHLSSKILLALWVLTFYTMAGFLLFLLPAIIIEICENPVIDRRKSIVFSFAKNTHIVSRVLVYLWIMIISVAILAHEDDFFVVLIMCSIMLLLPALAIERFGNKKINSEDTKRNTKNNVNTSKGFSSTYTDVIVSGVKEKLQSIPKSNKNITIKGDIKAIVTESEYSSITSTTEKFIKDMAKYEHTTVQRATFVPFQTYYPTYDSMNSRQKEWYFYWRSNVRKGIYLTTDLSYIYILIYELISGYGWNNAQDGYNQLYAVWTFYRKQYPNLDNHLTRWSFDFSLLHNTNFSLPNDIKIYFNYHTTNAIILDAIIEKYNQHKPLKLPFAIINSLVYCSISGRSFYKNGHQEIMHEAIPRVLALVDALLIKKSGKGIIEKCAPYQTEQRYSWLFGGANCLNANKKIYVSVKWYCNNQNLRKYVEEVCRYAENVLKEIYNCKGRLRDIELDKETENVIRAFLIKEYSEKEIKVANKEIKLDLESIRELREQSNSVRDALEVSDDDKIIEEQIDIAENDAENNSAEKTDAFNDEHDSIFDLTALSPELKILIENLSSAQKRIVYIILSQDNVNANIEEIANAEMSMPEILIDEINDIATQYIDDILIDNFNDDICILEQYEAELKKALI